MYSRDCKEIEDIGLATPQGMEKIVRFTLCTIQASLSGVKLQLEDINKVDLDSRFLWGQKAKGLGYFRNNREFIWGKVSKLREENKANDLDAITEALLIFMKVPNLGLVKAAFVCQMLGFDVACLDSHNLARLGMKPSMVAVPSKLGKESKIKRIHTYVKLTQEKGSEYWWNSWCEFVAGNRGNKDLDNGDLVSRFHVHCVKM